MFANGWFAACDGLFGASACWLSVSHMKQETITIYCQFKTFKNQTQVWI